VGHAERFARACGYERAFLSTLATMQGASELYGGPRGLGYAPLAPPGGSSQQALGFAVRVCYYEKALK
jgi:hypothetical protein